jgi:hypothetical protein
MWATSRQHVHSMRPRVNKCSLQHPKKTTNKFTATCGTDKTTHGATCAVTPDAGYNGGSLTCNGATGVYDAVTSTTTACTPGSIDATYNNDKQGTNKFTQPRALAIRRPTEPPVLSNLTLVIVGAASRATE